MQSRMLRMQVNQLRIMTPKPDAVPNTQDASEPPVQHDAQDAPKPDAVSKASCHAQETLTPDEDAVPPPPSIPLESTAPTHAESTALEHAVGTTVISPSSAPSQRDDEVKCPLTKQACGA